MTFLMPPQSRSTKDRLRSVTARRNQDAADRAMAEARHIGDLFVEIAGLKPDRIARASAVKAIAARLGISTEKVNARLYLLRGAKAEAKAGRKPA